MSKIKRTLAVLLSAVMILGMLPVMTSAATGEDSEPKWPNEGAISLSKEAAPIGDSGEYEITLTIEGKNFKTTSDVVLVIDNSNSMYYANGTDDDDGYADAATAPRMKNTIAAANAFVEQLLTEGSQNSIALVVYGTEVQQTTGFYGADQKQALINKISEISQNVDLGGTNQQAGLHAARELLKTSSGKMKNIVILSDGEPTYSYPFAVPSYGNVPANPTPDYDTRIGCGYHFNIGEDILLLVHQGSGNAGYNFLGFRSRGSYTYDNDGTFTFKSDLKTDNGVATIWEANQAKAEGITIFSVALQAGTNGENTLKDCATDNSCYYAISNSETDVPGKLTQAFTAIAGKIAIAASNGAVTDPMSDYVAMVIKATEPVITSDISVYNAGNADIYISQGTASWDSANETISWSVGNISEGTPAIMKYKVIVTDTSLQKGDEIPTNGITTFSYKNYLGNDTAKNFPIPRITLGAGSIKVHYYAVNSAGTPVNADGVAVETPYHAQELKAAVDFVYEGSSVLEYKTYTVTSDDSITNYRCMGYTLDKDDPDITEATSVNVSVSAVAPNQEVWFAYVPQFKVVHIYSDGTESTTENYDVVSNFNLTETVGKNYLYAGTFNSATCDTVYPFAVGENGLSFTPVKGATYFVKEVDNDYLRPKTLTLWHTNSNDLTDVNAAYFVTVIDSTNYEEVGFATQSRKNGDVSFDDDKENKVTTLGSTNIFNRIELTNKKGEKTIYTPDQFYQGEVTTGYLACSSIAKSEWANAGATITYTPYWITLDGVKVYGTTTRTIKYLGEGNKNFEKVGNDEENNYACEPEVLLTAATPLTLKARFVSDGSEFIEPVTPPEETDPIIPVKNTYTVTVHDNGKVYEVEVKKNSEAEIDYSGTLFAGWFTDEAYTEPADLSEITSDIDIYAKYVSNDYLCTKYIEQGWFRVYGMTLISALDSDNYADAGFVINGKEISCDYSESYGSFTARALFGSNIARGAKLMTYSLSLKAASNGDKFEVTPYWVTLDGTTVYGTTRTFTYNSRGIKG